MADFTMPSLGADMDAGTLLEWRVKSGDAVKRGDIVAVVDTSKAEIEIEIFEDGVIDELLVEEGTKVPVGTPLATVRTAGGKGPPPAPAEAAREASQQAAPVAPSATAPRPPAAAEEHRPRVSPLARRTAEKLGVDLTGIHGTGSGGAITRSDVENAAAAAPLPTGPEPATAAEPKKHLPASPTPAEAESRQAAMREAIGALMTRSKREIPHYYLETLIEMSSALAWLRQRNESLPVGERILPAALLLRAVATAAAEMPALNGFWLDGGFRPSAGVHLGVAISLRGGGLIAPALHDADRKSTEELMAALRDLVGRARGGRLRSSEMSDPTITVTNLGEQGADLVHGVIYPPQVALVGFGAIREQPWAAGGMVGPRPVVKATLAADHRASDGIAGSRFLALIDRNLQNPEEQ